MLLFPNIFILQTNIKIVAGWLYMYLLLWKNIPLIWWFWNHKLYLLNFLMFDSPFVQDNFRMSWLLWNLVEKKQNFISMKDGGSSYIPEHWNGDITIAHLSLLFFLKCVLNVIQISSIVYAVLHVIKAPLCGRPTVISLSVLQSFRPSECIWVKGVQWP